MLMASQNRHRLGSHALPSLWWLATVLLVSVPKSNQISCPRNSPLYVNPFTLQLHICSEDANCPPDYVCAFADAATNANAQIAKSNEKHCCQRTNGTAPAAFFNSALPRIPSINRLPRYPFAGFNKDVIAAPADAEFIATLFTRPVAAATLPPAHQGPAVSTVRRQTYALQCPTPVGIGNCSYVCKKDIDCPQGKRCCFNGCGRHCIVLTPSSPTAIPPRYTTASHKTFIRGWPTTKSRFADTSPGLFLVNKLDPATLTKAPVTVDLLATPELEKSINLTQDRLTTGQSSLRGSGATTRFKGVPTVFINCPTTISLEQPEQCVDSCRNDADCPPVFTCCVNSCGAKMCQALSGLTTEDDNDVQAFTRPIVRWTITQEPPQTQTPIQTSRVTEDFEVEENVSLKSSGNSLLTTEPVDEVPECDELEPTLSCSPGQICAAGNCVEPTKTGPENATTTRPSLTTAANSAATIVPRSPQQCSEFANAEFSPCAQPRLCQESCETLAWQPICSTTCAPGCVCKAGFVRRGLDDEGCIDRTSCETVLKTTSPLPPRTNGFSVASPTVKQQTAASGNDPPLAPFIPRTVAITNAGQRFKIANLATPPARIPGASVPPGGTGAAGEASWMLVLFHEDTAREYKTSIARIVKQRGGETKQINAVLAFLSPQLAEELRNDSRVKAIQPSGDAVSVLLQNSI